MIHQIPVDRSVTVRDGGKSRGNLKRPRLDPEKTLLEQDVDSKGLYAVVPEEIVLEPVPAEPWDIARPEVTLTQYMSGYEHIIYVADKQQKVRLDGCVMLSVLRAKAIPASWIEILKQIGARIHFDGEIVGWRNAVYTPSLAMWDGYLYHELTPVNLVPRSGRDFSAVLSVQGAGLKYEFKHSPF
jgi:hypothetical protein